MKLGTRVGGCQSCHSEAPRPISRCDDRHITSITRAGDDVIVTLSDCSYYRGPLSLVDSAVISKENLTTAVVELVKESEDLKAQIAQVIKDSATDLTTSVAEAKSAASTATSAVETAQSCAENACECADKAATAAAAAEKSATESANSADAAGNNAMSAAGAVIEAAQRATEAATSATSAQASATSATEAQTAAVAAQQAAEAAVANTVSAADLIVQADIAGNKLFKAFPANYKE